MRNSFLQMSDRNHHFPLLAVRDLSSESELLLLKVRFSLGFITGNSPVCGTGLIANGKSVYFTLLDLEVNPIMFVKGSSNRMSDLLIPSEPGSRRTAFGGKHLPIL